MGTNQNSYRQDVIPTIKRKKLFITLSVFVSLVIAFIVFSVFGLLEKYYLALDNSGVFDDTSIQMTKLEKIFTCIAISIQRILVYISPSLTIFTYLLFKSKKKKNKLDKKSKLKILLYIQNIVLFSYTLFSTFYYLTAMEYWGGFKNPFRNIDYLVFIFGILGSVILNQKVIKNNDDSIGSLIFGEKNLIKL